MLRSSRMGRCIRILVRNNLRLNSRIAPTFSTAGTVAPRQRQVHRSVIRSIALCPAARSCSADAFTSLAAASRAPWAAHTIFIFCRTVFVPNCHRHVNCEVLNKHLQPLLGKLGLERGGMHGFRHRRVSTLVMAGTPMAVIKKWIGHGSEDMVNRNTHLRPDFMRDELARVPRFAPELGLKIAEIDPFDPGMLAVA
jgi:integrase